MAQKRMIAALVGVIMLFACTAILATDNSMGIAEKRTIQFKAPTVIGETVLPAGNYNVTHEMKGQTHVMTFQQIGGSAQAKANCKLVPLKTKASYSEQMYSVNAKQEHILKEMTFEGDTSTHVLVP